MLAAISWSNGSSQTLTSQTTYALNSTNSDLTVAGADFNKEIDAYTGDISFPVSVAASATEYSYGFTKAGVPGAAGVTGDYIVDISIPSSGTNVNIQLSAAVARVNAAGTQQAMSAFATEQSAQFAGKKEFTFTGVNGNLGTWSAGDRLRVSYRFRNTAASTQSVTIAPNVAG